MPQLPDVLVERLRSGRCVLCAGAGLRALAGMPGWSGILDRLADLLGERGEPPSRVEELKRLVRAGRLFLAAGYIERKLGAETFASETREALKSPAELPEALRLLGQLPFRTIVSTAGDDLLERAFERDGVRPNVCTLADGRDLRREARSRMLLKVMGDIARPETVCLTSRDFEKALASSPGYQSFGEELAQKKSLVFIGFAAEDPDFSLLFDRFFVHAGQGETEHFALLPGLGEIACEELYERYKLRVISHGTPEEFIRELRAAVGETVERVVDEDDLEGYLRWLSMEPDSAEAADGLLRLERKAREAGDWERVVEVLLGRVESAEAGAMRADILCEVARVFENDLGDLPKAFTALVAAYREQPERSEIVAELERLASAADLWGELCSEFAQLAEHSDDPARYLQLGRWYLDRLNQVEYAIAALSHAFARSPSDDTGDALGEALRRGEKWAELAQLAEKRIAAASDDGRKIDLLLLLADVQESRTGELDKAIATYRRALELGGSEAGAQLERLYRRHQRWRELCDLLGKRADASSDAGEARALRREIGEILGDKLADVPAAVARLEGVVAEDPRDTAALRALERLYERAGQAAEYMSTLERLADAVQTPDERVLVLRRLAAEWEERDGGIDRAAECLERLLELRPRDEEALRALERIWRGAQRFPQLIETLKRHISVSDGHAARRELYGQIGQIYETELRDVPAAIEAFLCVEEAGGDALADLARLYQKSGDWVRAVEVLPRLAERTAAAGERAQLWHQAGRIALERLRDDSAAESYLAKALEADGEHLPAMIELGQVYERRGEWLRAAKLMTEAAERTSNRLDKTRLLYEAGRLYQERLDDETRAQELYVRALALDPEHVPAASRLAGLYEKAEQWAELEPVLDVLARKVDRADSQSTVDVLIRLGFAAKQSGHDDKAIKAYREALSVDPTSLAAQAGLAGLLLKKGELGEAGKLYQQILSHHGEGLTAGERLDLYTRKASIEEKQGNLDAAIDLYKRAIEIDTFHRPSLLALVELYGKTKQWSPLVDAKRGLLETAQGEERGKILEDIGDILLDKLEDPIQAMGAYQQALEHRPGRALLLHKVLDLCTEQKQWRKAVDVIFKLIDLETDPAKRAKYRYAAAAILHDELGEHDKALELYELVLDDAPDTQGAFEAIEDILSKREDWKGLGKAYRRMIKRLPAEGLNEIRLRLWSNLGDLALTKLGDREVALASFEVATSLDRQSVPRHERLAELYIEAGPDYADKAIAEQQWLLRRQPDRLQSYKSLRKLYNTTRQFDKMWCVCQSLRFLKRAEPEEIEFYERLKPQKFTPAKRKLTEEIWLRNVIHPDEDRLVNTVFALVGPAVAAWSAQPHKAFGLSRKDKTDPAQHEHIAARAFRYAVETLGIPQPELYFRPDQPAAVQVANAIDKDKGQIIPAFMVGQQLIEKPREKELVFEIAKRLVFLRPERYVRYALPTPKALESALRAGLSASGASNGAPVDGETAKLVEHLRRVLPPPLLEQLALVGRKLLDAKPDVFDLSSWLSASDLTATRAAFSLINDFEVAARMVSTEQPGLSPLPAKERLKELLVFAVSEDYFAIRKQLGVEVQLS